MRLKTDICRKSEAVGIIKKIEKTLLPVVDKIRSYQRCCLVNFYISLSRKKVDVALRGGFVASLSEPRSRKIGMVGGTDVTEGVTGYDRNLV